MHIAFLSPHLDDALLSCGILIQRLSKQNHITVITICTEGDNTPARRLEDQIACQKLGIDTYHLGCWDAPDRNPAIQTIADIVFSLFSEHEETTLRYAVAKLSEYCCAQNVQKLYAPLGIGYHIDHRLTFSIAQAVSIPVVYYEDRPYVLWNGLLSGRFHQAGIRANIPEHSPQKSMNDLQTKGFLSYFVPQNQRKELIPLYESIFTTTTRIKYTAIQDTSIVATEAEFLLLWDSLQSYTSQMQYIYPSLDSFVQDNNIATTGYKENYWLLCSI